MTEGTVFGKKGKCKNSHCSPLSTSAWCDFIGKVDILKLHDICPNSKNNCQKQLIFTSRQFQLQSVFKNKLK